METDKKLTEMDKLAHLLDHWQEHNADHAANYRTWAGKAEAEGNEAAAALLREAAEATDRITDLFIRARQAL